MLNRGQYMDIAKEHERSFGTAMTIRIVLYGAYNAMGLIGPEVNGIAILQEHPRRCVLLDEHMRKGYGWYNGGGPSVAQLEEFDRIAALDNSALLLFIQSHPRFRGVSLEELLGDKEE